MGLHGIPRGSSTSFHGQPRTLHGLPRTLHGLPRTFHGLPRNAAASSGTPWRPMALAMAISTAISTATHGKHPQLTTAVRGTTERPAAMPTAWRWPWNTPWQLPWYLGGLPWLVSRRLARTEPRHMPWPQPWHLPLNRHVQWKAVDLAVETRDFHDSPWRDPRKTTEVPRSLPRTSI